jgi:3-isopropylmalate/(R)-2-methylmalate dehydratase small subunit
MESLTRLTALAAPLPEADVDTDIIFPARFLLITSKSGLGRYAFYERRYDAEGAPKPSFVLNRPQYAGAQILVTGDNFGSGSSREHAVWALRDMGFRAVIAPRFGEIFAANCLKNGMAPVALPAAAVASLMDDAREGRPITVDVAEQVVGRKDGERFAFTLPAAARQALLNGWDEVEVLLNAHADEISAFETRQRAERPWLYVQD